MNKIWQYISAFLSGSLVIALIIISYLLKNIKPIINTDSYIESVEQSVKKLKQSGTNNSQDIKGSIDLTEEPKRKKLLGVFKRKNK